MPVRILSVGLLGWSLAAAGELPQGKVRVVWQGSPGEEVEGEKYVGLVPWGAEVKAVVAEVTVQEKSAVLSAPPGKYRLLCGGEGFLLAPGGPVEVKAGEEVEGVCRMVRGVELYGLVVAQETGRPLEGVEVTVYGAAVEEGLSPLALEVARRAVTGRTNREGVFVLRGQPNSFASLVFSAAGRALTVAERVFFPPLPGVGDAGEFALPPGSDVHLQWTGPLPEAGEVEVALWPVKNQEYRKREEVARLWRRKVAPGQEVQLQGVPVGVYEVRGSFRDGSEEIPLYWGPLRVEAPLEIFPLPLAEVELKGQLRGLTELASWQCALELISGQGGSKRLPLQPNGEGVAPVQHRFLSQGHNFLGFVCTSPVGGELRWGIWERPFAPGRWSAKVDWELPRGVFSGRVVEPAGQGASQVEVLLQGHAGCSLSWGDSYFCQATTDEAGFFRCPGAPQERALVWTRPQAQGVLEPRWASSGETLALSAGRPLRVRVSGPEQQPLEQAWVQFYCREFPARWLLSERTKGEGVVEIHHAPACKGFVVIRHKAYASQWQSVPPERPWEVEVELGPGVTALLDGTSFRQASARCGEKNAELFLEQGGELVPLAALEWGRRFALEDPASALRRLRPGQKYRLVLVDPDCHVCARSRNFSLQIQEEPQEISPFSP